MKSKYFLLGFLTFLLLGAANYQSNILDMIKYNKKWIALTSRNGVSQIGGVSLITKFGVNYDLDDAEGHEYVSAQGGAIPLLTTGAQLNIKSDNSNDAALGNGARTILISGIDASGNKISSQITMNGTSEVTSDESYVFVNRATVLTSGAGNRNSGDITIRHSTSDSILAFIESTYSVTQQLGYRLANNEQCWIDRLRLRTTKQSGGQTPFVNFHIHVYSTSQETEYIIRDVDKDTSVADMLQWDVGFKDQPLLPNEYFWVEADQTQIIPGYRESLF